MEGFPTRSLHQRQPTGGGFFADYVRTITTRDVRELADLEHTASLRAFVGLIAGRTATEANLAELARALALPASTVRRYLPLFESIYLHQLLPAWSRNLTAKVVRRPKIHMVDSGLASHLLGVDPAGLGLPTSPASGPLLESFVAGEIARQLTWSETEATLYHWRDRSGLEVGLLMETPDGRVVGVEVKASVDVRDDDFRGLQTLRNRLGDRFIAGVVIHCGERVRPSGPRLWSVPVATLWTLD